MIQLWDGMDRANQGGGYGNPYGGGYGGQMTNYGGGGLAQPSSGNFTGLKPTGPSIGELAQLSIDRNFPNISGMPNNLLSGGIPVTGGLNQGGTPVPAVTSPSPAIVSPYASPATTGGSKGGGGTYPPANTPPMRSSKGGYY